MITTLSGSNGFLLQAQLKGLISDFVAKYSDMGLERIDASDASIERIRDAVQSLPFLADKKLVVIESPGSNKQLGEAMQDILGGVSDQTDVVIVEPKFDKRSLLYKLLKKQTDFKEFNELDDAGLTKWLADYARQQGGDLNTQSARYLLQRVGSNQLHLKNEVDKLVTYNPAINIETIDLLVDSTPQSTIFDLLDAALTGNTKRAMQLYQEQRSLRVEPQAILALLAWQLHVLAVVKAAGNRPAAETASAAKLNPFVVRKTSGLVNRLSGSQLKNLIAQTLELDIRLKSERIDADEALQNLLISISN